MNCSNSSDIFLSLDSDQFSDALDDSLDYTSLSNLLDQSFISHKKNFNICHINAQSLPAHHSELLATFTSDNIHACLISESFLKPTLPSRSYDLPGFVLIRNDRTGKGGGGVAIYLRSQMKYKVVSSSASLYSSSMEHLFIEVTLKTTARFLLGVIYSPPTIDYFSTLEQLLDLHIPQYEHFMIMGDFNTCLLRNDRRSSKLNNIVSSLDLTLLDLQPTYHLNDSHTKLDLILTRKPDLIAAYGQFPAPGFSHHDLIYASYKLKNPKCKPKIILQRNLAAVNWEKLCSDAGELDWDLLLNASDINEKVMVFNTLLNELYDTHAPKKPVRMKRPAAPWLTDEIKKLMSRRDYLYRKYRKTKNDENLKSFKKARNRCNQAVRNAKRRHIFSAINNSSPSNIWKVLRNLGFGKSKTSMAPSVDLNALNKHFTAIPSRVQTDIKSHTITQLNNTMPRTTCESFSLKTVSENEVQRIINNLRSKAVGHDGIGRELIIPLLEVILPYITHVINFSITSNYFPDAWKYAHIIPIPKKVVSCDLKDYRPISILPFLSKVLERVVHRQLSQYLQSNNLLTPFQSGFRTAHSTCTALIKIIDDIRSSIDQRKLTLLTLLDFSNAFNCVDHDIILAIMRSQNLSQSASEWFLSYLGGRQQRIQIDDIFSDWTNIEAGVPQGGVLSPLLFSIFINSLVSHLSFSSFHLYADDVQLYLSFSPDDISAAISHLNADLAAVFEWTHKYGLSINPSKTQVMLAGSSGILAKTDLLSYPSVKYNGISIKYCKEVKNLGLVISQNLSWDNHITEISRKMYGSIHSLKRLKNFLPQHAKVTLVTSLLLPILDYADVCYTDATEEQLNKLERLLNLCIRYIYGLRKYDHVSNFRFKLKWLNIRYRRNAHAVCLLYNIIFHPYAPNYLKDKFTFTSIRGRPQRSSQHLQLLIPQHKSELYSNSFTVTAIRLWNSLPPQIRQASSMAVFKTKVYNHYLALQNKDEN